ncbi:MAG: IS30 family transposase [Candidatus Synoicihabitans palmerolidicus]|nr:IS30 family transposase [Candidatus Synoicihabitans palmerolidicus]
MVWSPPRARSPIGCSVDQRPAEVEDRLIAGHYEGDLILGAGNRSAVGVFVERTTRYTMFCHLPHKDAQSVREAFTRRLAADLGLQVFFCLPHSPWEHGTCESQNGCIRHYLPKGSDLSTVSYQQLSAYQQMLNERPRKILGWKSPAQLFKQLISNLDSN